MRRALIRFTFASLLALSAASAMPPQTPPPVETIDFKGSNDFILTGDYAYVIGHTSTAVIIPKGFVTDYASIPPWLRWLFSRQGVYSRAAAVHDYLYWSRICKKDQADNILMIAMKELHVSAMTRWAIYEGVHRWGGGAWKEDGEQRQAGEPKVVPQSYYWLATENDWPQARQQLIQKQVHDPAFAPDPAACALGNSDVVPGPPQVHA